MEARKHNNRKHNNNLPHNNKSNDGCKEEEIEKTDTSAEV